MTVAVMTDRERAASRRRTCSLCLRGLHPQCVTASCAHYGCPSTEPEPRERAQSTEPEPDAKAGTRKDRLLAYLAELGGTYEGSPQDLAADMEEPHPALSACISVLVQERVLGRDRPTFRKVWLLTDEERAQPRPTLTDPAPAVESAPPGRVPARGPAKGGRRARPAARPAEPAARPAAFPSAPLPEAPSEVPHCAGTTDTAHARQAMVPTDDGGWRCTACQLTELADGFGAMNEHGQAWATDATNQRQVELLDPDPTMGLGPEHQARVAELAADLAEHHSATADEAWQALQAGAGVPRDERTTVAEVAEAVGFRPRLDAPTVAALQRDAGTFQRSPEPTRRLVLPERDEVGDRRRARAELPEVTAGGHLRLNMVVDLCGGAGAVSVRVDTPWPVDDAQDAQLLGELTALVGAYYARKTEREHTQ